MDNVSIIYKAAYSCVRKDLYYSYYYGVVSKSHIKASDLDVGVPNAYIITRSQLQV